MDLFKPGDKVKVSCPGLARLRALMPEDTKPNHHGFIKEKLPDGSFLIEFPIGDDDMCEHSQVAPYPAYMIEHR